MADPSAQGRYVQDDAVAAQVQERMSLQRILVSESSPTLRPLSTPPITVVVTASHNDDAMPIRRSHSMANMVDGAQTPTPVTDSDDGTTAPGLPLRADARRRVAVSLAERIAERRGQLVHG